MYKEVNPDSPPQYLTRLVLADHFNRERDLRIAAGVFRALPPTLSVDVVAAYGSMNDFKADT
jgi:hypothetical protein